MSKSTRQYKTNNRPIEHLTEKIKRMRLVDYRLLHESMIPSLMMQKYTVEDTKDHELDYPEYINEHKIWSLFGLFMDYALRRIISRLSKQPISDTRCEDVISLRIKSGTLNYHSDVIDTISSAYQKYKDSTLSTRSTLQDTWIVSLSHSIWFGSITEDRYNFLCGMKLSAELETVWTDRLKHMIRGLGRILCESGKVKIIPNPSLSIPGIIKADADLIIGDSIVDFKCSRNNPVTTKNFIQILGYAALSRRLGICKARYVIILNPLSGMIAIQDITSWNSTNLYNFIRDN